MKAIKPDDTYDIILHAEDITPVLLRKLEEIAESQGRSIDKVIISLIARILGFPVPPTIK